MRWQGACVFTEKYGVAGERAALRRAGLTVMKDPGGEKKKQCICM